MARKSNSGKLYQNPEMKKTKQRFADSKYRYKVQFLYDLLRKNCEYKLSKDSLLNAVYENIIKMENDIVHLCGSKILGDLKEQFSRILQIEEDVWKKEKDPSKWWEIVQESLNEFVSENSNSYSCLDSLSQSSKSILKCRRRSRKESVEMQNKKPQFLESNFNDDSEFVHNDEIDYHVNNDVFSENDFDCE